MGQPTHDVRDSRRLTAVKNGYSTINVLLGEYVSIDKTYVNNRPDLSYTYSLKRGKLLRKPLFIWPERAYTVQKTVQNQAYISEPHSIYTDYYFGNLMNFENNVLPFLGNNDYLKLHNKLYERVKGHDWNMGVALGEGAETVSMIANNAGRIAHAIMAGRKGRWNEAKDALFNRHFDGKNRDRFKYLRTRPDIKMDSFADKYLELQFGVNPLLGDIHSGANALANMLNRPLKNRVYVRKRNYLSKVYDSGFWVQRIEKVSLCADVISQPTFARSLSLDDPYSIAWNLLPYSFVLDWFLPVSDYFENAANVRSTIFGPVIKSYSHWDVRTQADWRPILKRKGVIVTGEQYMQQFTFTRDPSYVISRTLFPNFKSIEEAFSFKRIAESASMLLIACTNSRTWKDKQYPPI